MHMFMCLCMGLCVHAWRSAGDYFGELALLNDKPRAASVVCVTDSICVCMDSQSFKRLLGSCETIMRRNFEVYEQVMRDLLSG